jgi:hypothetical protein
MRRSRLNFVIPQLFLAAACGSFGARGLDGTVPPQSDVGIAGYSYDAGVSQGGQAGAKPAKPPNPQADVESSGAGGAASEDGPRSRMDEGGASSGEAGEAGHDAMGSANGASAAGHGGGGGAAAGGRAGGAGQGAAGHGVAGRAQAGASSSGGAGAHAGGAGYGGQAGTTELGGASSAAGTSGAPGVPRPILLSEYVEGSDRVKALELRALSSTTLDGCAVVTYSNGTSRVYRHPLAGTLAAGETHVLCSPTLFDTLHDTCDESVDLKFNGNDAVALECDGASIDVIGQIGIDPGAAWTGSGVSTANQTLRRLCSVTAGHAPSSELFDPSVEWQAFAVNDVSDLGHSACD